VRVISFHAAKRMAFRAYFGAQVQIGADPDFRGYGNTASSKASHSLKVRGFFVYFRVLTGLVCGKKRIGVFTSDASQTALHNR